MLACYYKAMLRAKGVKPGSREWKTAERMANRTTELKAVKILAELSGLAMGIYSSLPLLVALPFLNGLAIALFFIVVYLGIKIGIYKGSSDAFYEVVKASMQDDNLSVAKANGNLFLYDKAELDPRKYVKELREVGERKQGETWTLYLSGDGELVIY